MEGGPKKLPSIETKKLVNNETGSSITESLFHEEPKKENFASPFSPDDINIKVLQLLAFGYTNLDIANELGLRKYQLKDRLRWIAQKIAVDNLGSGMRQRIIQKAIELKLIPEVEPVGEHKLYKSLTRAEIQILEEMVKMPGITNKELAKKFDKAELTVKDQLKSIFDKLGVSNRFEATIFYKARQNTAPKSEPTN